MPRIITSLDKGLQILEVLNDSEGPQTLASLARRFPWDKSTVFRTLETLSAREFVVPGEDGYELGPSARAMGGHRVIPSILERARELMVVTAERSAENAHLAVATGNEMVFIDQCSGGRFTLHTEVGGREPLHCTAIGKAYLSTVDPQALDRVLAALSYAPFTKRTCRTPEALGKEVASAQRLGYAIDNREYSDDVRCAAVALVDAGGRFQASLGLSGPASRISLARLAELGEMLYELAVSNSLHVRMAA